MILDEFFLEGRFRHVKFRDCTYNTKDNTAVLTILYSEDIENLDQIRPEIERLFKDAIKTNVDPTLRVTFQYKKAYTDAQLLKMDVKKFLTVNYSILTLNLTDDDIHVEDLGGVFRVNVHLPKQSVEYIRASKPFLDFVHGLHEENFCTFEFFFDAKAAEEGDTGRALEKLDRYMKDSMPKDSNVKVEKTLRVKNIEYWLGVPVKQRPIKIEFLRTSQTDEQIIAGTIKFLTRREKTRPNKKTGAEEEFVFWTFVLDDGRSKCPCVFFSTEKTRSKFEKLVDGTVICAVGINSERNGRVGFNVRGIGFCEFA